LKFILDNWPLMLLALTSGGFLLWPVMRQSAAGSGAISTSEAVRLINREKGVLIDVSDSAEFAVGHANGARNIPLAQLEGSKDLPSNKALPVVLMCSNGTRAKRAAATLRKAGYDKAVAVSGGTAAWREALLPIQKAAGKAA
jgi:rhodanese-related sulfurtransferase